MRLFTLAILLVALNGCASSVHETATYVNELNSHRTNKLKTIRDRHTRQWAETIAKSGHVSHDKDKQPNQAEIILVTYDDVDQFYVQWYSSEPHRRIMLDESFDFVSVAIVDEKKDRSGRVNDNTGRRFVVARFWSK